MVRKRGAHKLYKIFFILIVIFAINFIFNLAMAVASMTPQELNDFQTKYGDKFIVDLNENTGTPWIYGYNIPLIDNESKIIKLSKSNIESVTKNFLLINERLLRIKTSDLVLESAKDDFPFYSQQEQGFWYVFYQQYYHGTRVFGGTVEIIIVNGRIVSARSNFVSNIENISSLPKISQEKAKDIAKNQLSFNTQTDTISEPSLEYFPDTNNSYHLAWSITIKSSDILNGGLFVIDTQTGGILFHDNLLRFYTISGNVTGQVYPVYPSQAQITRNFENEIIRVIDNNTANFIANTSTNVNGYYSISNTSIQNNITVNSNFNGTYVWVFNDNITVGQPLFSNTTLNLTSDKIINWNWQDYNSQSDRQEESNIFYHVNFIHDFYTKGSPFNITEFNYQTKATIESSLLENAGWDWGCNAYFWSGDNNSQFGNGWGVGSDCENLALGSDIIYHEYTHAADYFIYMGSLPYARENGALDEGSADYFSSSINNDPIMGDGIFTGARLNAQRNLTNKRIYPRDLQGGLGCAPVTGNDYCYVHNNSLLISGAMWDMRQLFVLRYGLEVGQNISDNLIITAHKTRMASSSNPNGEFGAFEKFLRAIFTVDDDNGDLTDGTPHRYEICKAFSLNHNITTNSTECFAIHSTNLTGNYTKNFSSGDFIYGYGWTYYNNTNVTVYMVKYNTTQNWSSNFNLEAIKIASLNVTTDDNGTIPNTLIWNATNISQITSTGGRYNLIINIDKNGYFNTSKDIVDNRSGFGFRVQTIASTNSSGNLTNVFNFEDPIYAKGVGFSNNTNVSIYIVSYNQSIDWKSNLQLNNYLGNITNVTTTENGTINNTWMLNATNISQIFDTNGRYNLVADINKDGYFNKSIDSVNYFDNSSFAFRIQAIASINSSGNFKSNFSSTGPIYARAVGFPNNTNASIYVISYNSSTNWSINFNITNFIGNKTNVTIFENGTINNTLIWNATNATQIIETGGRYTVIVDNGKDGYYNSSIDGVSSRLNYSFRIQALLPVNSTGSIKDYFGIDDAVYTKGVGFPSNKNVSLYVVNNSNFTNGIQLRDVSGAIENVTTNSEGRINVTNIWNNSQDGIYYIVADVDQDGHYNNTVDTISDLNITICLDEEKYFIIDGSDNSGTLTNWSAKALRTPLLCAGKWKVVLNNSAIMIRDSNYWGLGHDGYILAVSYNTSANGTRVDLGKQTNPTPNWPEAYVKCENPTDDSLPCEWPESVPEAETLTGGNYSKFELSSPGKAELFFIDNLEEDWGWDNIGYVVVKIAPASEAVTMYINIHTLKDVYGHNELVGITDPPKEDNLTNETSNETILAINETNQLSEIIDNQTISNNTLTLVQEENQTVQEINGTIIEDLIYPEENITLSDISLDDSNLINDLSNEYKIVNYGGIYLAALKTEHCSYKPDSINEGYKICSPIVLIYNTENSPVEINTSKDNLKLDITHKIKDNFLSTTYSTDFEFYKEKFVNKSCIADCSNINITEDEFICINKCSYNLTRAALNNWKNLDNEVNSIPSRKLVALKFEFEIPQYSQAQYNFSYLPLNFLLDPDISACGAINSAGTYTQTADIIPDSGTSCIIINSSDVIYDGNGFSISNSTFNGNGIYTSGNNTTIKNCNITTGTQNYNSGVYLKSNNNLVQNSTLKSNSYGLYLDNSYNSMIDILMSNNNYIYGIEILGGGNNTLTNIITNSNRVYGISLEVSKGNKMYNITSNNNDKGIILSANSSDNLLQNISISNCINASSLETDGIMIYGSGNNIITFGKINNCQNLIDLKYSTGIIFPFTSVYRGSNNNTLKDLTLTNSTIRDVYLISYNSSEGNNLNNIFINSTYDLSKEYVTPNSQLTRKWYFTAQVNDTNGNPIQDADIVGYNVSGGLIDNRTTDSTGKAQLELIDYVNNGGTRIYYSNYSVNVSKAEYSSEIHSHNLTAENNIVDSFTLSGPPQIEFVYPTPNNNSLQESTSIYVNISSNDTNTHYAFVDFDRSNILWMTMDAVNSSGSPIDLSSWSNNGTAIGNATQVDSGKFGKGFSFDGISGAVSSTLDVSPNLLQGATVAMWFKPNVLPSIFDYIPVLGSDSNNLLRMKNDGTSCKVQALLWNGTDVSVVSTTTVLTNTWYFAVWRWDNSTQNLSLWVNGVNEKSTVTSGSISWYDNIRLGNRAASYYNGSIDDVLIFNRSLSASEILSLYNATANKYYNNFTSIADGVHTITGYAVDSAGNRNNTEQRTIGIDTSNPVVAFVIPTPLDNSSQAGNSIYVNLSSSDAGQHYVVNNFDNSLVGWWTMEGSANDSIGSAHGTLIDNASIVSSGKFGKSLIVDGDGDYLRTGNIVYNSSGNFSYSVWVKPLASYSGDYPSWITHLDNSDTYVGLMFGQDSSGRISVYNYLSGTEVVYLDGFTPALNVWKYYTLMIEGGAVPNVTLYIDGVEQTLTNVPDNYLGEGYGAAAFIDLGYFLETGLYSNVQIDEFMYFNRILSSQEILALYNATANQYYNNFTNLSVGNHTVTAYAVNSLGNKNQTETRTISVTLPQSKIVNNGIVNVAIYLLMKVQHYTGSYWEDKAITYSNSSPININSSETIELDKYWNQWNTTSSPVGTYRVYVAVVDEDNNTLMNTDGSEVSATHNFTII